MNRLQSATKWLIAVAVAMFALAGVSAAQVLKGSEEARPELKLTTEQVSKIKLAVERPVALSLWAITSQEFTGNFASVKQHLDEFQAELKKEGLDKQIKEKYPPGLLILLEDPTGKGEFRMKVGCEVAEKLSPKAPLSIEQIQHPQAVRYLHTGRYADLANLHAGIRANLKTSKAHISETKWPVTLRLLDDPAKVGEDKVRTEMVVPVS